MAKSTVDGYIESLEGWQADAAKELRRIAHVTALNRSRLGGSA